MTQINTILLAVTSMISALTPIMLALINRRQRREVAAKVARTEEMHQEILARGGPIA